MVSKPGYPPHIAAEADGHEALLTLVALGYGTGIIPDLVLQHSGVRTRLRQLPTPSGPGQLAIGICIRRADLHRPLIAAAWAETRPGQSNRSEHAAPS
nr:LysR substrate-binding domain-containing protein [Streptomyces europaeiscabiei]